MLKRPKSVELSFIIPPPEVYTAYTAKKERKELLINACKERQRMSVPKYTEKLPTSTTDKKSTQITTKPSPLLPQTSPNYLFFKQRVFLPQNLIVEVPSCSFK